MRFVLAAISACLALAGPPRAAAEELRLLDTPAEIFGLEAVGRVDYLGTNDRGFCTGTLITRSLVLTAAHCVTAEDGRPRAVADLTFRAGLRLGRAKGERGVRRIAIHPAYVHSPVPSVATVASDLALLELDRPLDYWTVPPLPTTTQLGQGQGVQVVSYARGRDDTPSRETACSVLARTGAVLALDCQATFGASGSPVFVSTSAGLRISSVVSAIGTFGNERATYAVVVADAVEVLIEAFPHRNVPARLASPGRRTLRPGDRAGASGTIRFLRPGD